MLRRRRSSRRVLLLVAVTLSLFWMFPSPAPARDYAVGAGPYSVAVGDLNGDGRLDLVVANSLANTVSVLLGNGDGTFQAARNFDAGLGSGPIWVVVVDINGDGKADVLLANQSRHSLGVLLGNGDGTLQPPMNFDTAGNLPESIAVGDFNGDGKLDVAVAHFYSTNVTVLLGNGDGTFRPALTFPVGNRNEFVAVGDFNGDGTLDVAVASYNTNTVGVLMGNGDGTFANLPTAATPVLSPGGGTYSSSVVVTLTDSTPGA